jgi:hypothetical protein
MGGLGSGRWRDRGRETVESHRFLDVNRLSVMGCLRPGWSGTCHWIDGNEVASISLRTEAERLHLSYAVRVGDGAWEDVPEIIPIVWVPCRFGGSRAYFICPGSRDGSECGRRIAKLHLSSRHFLCRHCTQLAYASQYEQPWERALRRVNKLRQRLRSDSEIVTPVPEKPKRMWVRTYARLLEETLQAEILADEARANHLQRFVTQIEITS